MILIQHACFVTVSYMSYSYFYRCTYCPCHQDWHTQRFRLHPHSFQQGKSDSLYPQSYCRYWHVIPNWNQSLQLSCLQYVTSVAGKLESDWTEGRRRRHALAFRRFVGLNWWDTVFDDHGSVPISWARFCTRPRVLLLASCTVCHDGHSPRYIQCRCLQLVYNRYIFIFKLIK